MICVMCLTLIAQLFPFFFFLGDVGAFMSVAHCYSNGKGVENNYDEAFRYHKMAADKGK